MQIVWGTLLIISRLALTTCAKLKIFHMGAPLKNAILGRCTHTAIIFNNYSSRPHGLWVNSPWGDACCNKVLLVPLLPVLGIKNHIKLCSMYSTNSTAICLKCSDFSTLFTRILVLVLAEKSITYIIVFRWNTENPWNVYGTPLACLLSVIKQTLSRSPPTAYKTMARFSLPRASQRAPNGTWKTVWYWRT